MAGAFRLKDALKDLDGYEYIIIDTAPALGELTKNALIAANEVIVPASADRYSIQGLSSIVQSVNAIQRSLLNPELKISGIVLVAYPVTTNLGAEIQEELKGIAEKIGTKVFQPPIRRTIRVQQAHAHRMPIIYYDRNCTAAEDYLALGGNLLGGV